MDTGELFRGDAKATDPKDGSTPEVRLGAWMCAGGVAPEDAPWFSIEITPQNCPWVFSPKVPRRRVASLELLQTLVGLVVFAPLRPKYEIGLDKLTAGTDNKANGFVMV